MEAENETAELKHLTCITWWLVNDCNLRHIWSCHSVTQYFRHEYVCFFSISIFLLCVEQNEKLFLSLRLSRCAEKSTKRPNGVRSYTHNMREYVCVCVFSFALLWWHCYFTYCIVICCLHGTDVRCHFMKHQITTVCSNHCRLRWNMCIRSNPHTYACIHCSTGCTRLQFHSIQISSIKMS